MLRELIIYIKRLYLCAKMLGDTYEKIGSCTPSDDDANRKRRDSDGSREGIHFPPRPFFVQPELRLIMFYQENVKGINYLY
jgi:hypothetical protein